MTFEEFKKFRNECLRQWSMLNPVYVTSFKAGENVEKERTKTILEAVSAEFSMRLDKELDETRKHQALFRNGDHDYVERLIERQNAFNEGFLSGAMWRHSIEPKAQP